MSATSNYPTARMLGGAGILLGPLPNTQFNSVVDLIIQSLPHVAASAMKDGISNEDGLNSLLALFISKAARKKGLPFIVQHQSMEVLTHGGSPAPDIGIHIDVLDDAEPPPRIMAFEGNRLSAHLGSKRRREYVIGHVENGKHIPCGGIERFKKSIHGRELTHAGMIGYMQDGTPDHWRHQINSWISELSQQTHDPSWLEQEHLTPLTINGQVIECSSIVFRDSGELHIAHIWIDLVT